MKTGQVIGIAVGLIFLVILGMVGCPVYNVYTSKMEVEAVLAHAQYSRQVAVAEAKAKLESAYLLLQADTIRAHGVARSNVIIGSSLSEAYLRWLFVSELNTTKDQVIYLPTEAGLPILEAGKRINVQNPERSVATGAQ